MSDHRLPDGPPPTVDDVTSALATVIDPELGADIVSLGMVGDISLDGPDVQIAVKLTTRACPLRSEIERDVRSTIGRHPGLRSVTVVFDEMDATERAALMDRARHAAQQRGPRPELGTNCRVLAVASGKGGVGKSSITANLATALAAAGHTVGVLDADIWGFSMPRLLGMSDTLNARAHPSTDRPLITPNSKSVGAGELKVVSTGFLVDDTTALMWRGLMLNRAVEQFLLDVDWGGLDYLVIDLPPGTGDVQMGIARMLPDAELLIVTTPAVAAQRVAQRAADMARRSFLTICGVIENMSSFRCAHGEDYALFGSGGGQTLADAIGVPLLAQVPLDPSVSTGNDAGTPVAATGGPVATVFRELAQHLVDTTGTEDESPDAAGCTARLLAAVDAAVADSFGDATSDSDGSRQPSAP